MILGSLSDALQSGLPYSLAFLGVWLTFRLQGEFDLTVDNSFTLGAAVLAVWVTHGGRATIAVILAIAAGAAAGLATYTVRRLLGLSLILASIIFGTGLYSLNLRIMGAPNLNLFGASDLVQTWASAFTGDDFTAATIELFAVIVAVVFAGVMLFLRTELGLVLRANGLNRSVVRSNAGSPEALLALAVIAGNALAAASGALFAQQEGYADVSMGIGTLISAVTAILIGETLIGARGPTIRGVLAVLVGAIAYRFMLALAFRAGVDPTYFQGITAIIVIAVLAARRGIGSILPLASVRLADLHTGRRRGRGSLAGEHMPAPRRGHGDA
jgi:putative tryptophan/tyrosine transport system permease protein